MLPSVSNAFIVSRRKDQNLLNHILLFDEANPIFLGHESIINVKLLCPVRTNAADKLRVIILNLYLNFMGFCIVNKTDFLTLFAGLVINRTKPFDQFFS